MNEPEEPAPRALVSIMGDASPEEVAALVAVVQAMAAAGAAPARRPRSAWADPVRQVRRPHHAGPGGWTRSGLPG